MGLLEPRTRTWVAAMGLGLGLTLLPTSGFAQPTEEADDTEPSRRDPGSAQPPPGYSQAPPPGYGAPPPGYGPPPGYAPYGGYYYPAVPPPPPVPKRRRSTGMMVAGIVLTGIGGVSLLAGAVVIAAGSTYTCTYRYDTASGYDGDCGTNDEVRGAGVVTMLAGGAMIAVGIPLLVVGARKVPANEAAAKPLEPSLEPTVMVAPTGGSLRWAF